MAKYITVRITEKQVDFVLYALGYIAEFAGDGGDHTEADGRKADAAAKAIRESIEMARSSTDRSKGDR